MNNRSYYTFLIIFLPVYSDMCPITISTWKKIRFPFRNTRASGSRKKKNTRKKTENARRMQIGCTRRASSVYLSRRKTDRIFTTLKIRIFRPRRKNHLHLRSDYFMPSS